MNAQQFNNNSTIWVKVNLLSHDYRMYDDKQQQKIKGKCSNVFYMIADHEKYTCMSFFKQ